jgi:glycosyltransferase involved in cell wall biosynthesis
MKVLMLLENCPYPRDFRVHHEAETLANEGYQVSLICPALPGQVQYEVLAGVHVYRYRDVFKGHGLLGYLLEYGYALVITFLLSLVVWCREGIDTVHAHNPPDVFVLIGAFYKLFGKCFIYDHHDLAPEMYMARTGDRAKKSIYDGLIWFEKLSYRLADHVIVTNQSYKQIAIQRGCVPEKRITIVRNGPDLRRFCPSPLVCSSSNKTLLGYVGVMGPQDGLDCLLHILQCLIYNLERKDAFCVLIGDGDAVPSLKILASKLQLDTYLRFTGWVDDVLPYLDSIDICLAPEPYNAYNDQSTTIKLMEYMAMAKPIVAFALTEHCNTAGDAALYAAPGDVPGFARNIAYLLDHPEERIVLGAIGRKRIATTLEWHYQAQNLLTAYEALKKPSSGKRVSA